MDGAAATTDLPFMLHLAAATLASVLWPLAPDPAAPPLPPAALWTDDGTVLEVPLAHRDRDRVDAGTLRVDRARRVVTWEGLAEEIGCPLRLEAPFADVASVAEARGAGLVLALRGGGGRELTLIPPAHFALLLQPTVRKRGGITREEAIAGRLRNDGVYVFGTGSGAFAGPASRAVTLPEAARRDVRDVVAALRAAIGL